VSEQAVARANAVGRWTTAWLDALTSGTAVVPLGGADLPALAKRLAKATASGLGDPERAPAAAETIAGLLAGARLTSPDVLRRAVLLLGSRGPELAPDAGAALPVLLSSVADRHAAAARDILLDQQEAIHQASLTSLLDAERALFASEARFRAVFAEAAIGIGIGDLQGQILDVNHALEDMLGYSVDQFRTRRVDEFVHPDDVAEVWQGYSDLVAGRIDAFRAEKRYLHRKGHTVWTQLTLSLIRANDGTPAYQLAMMEDVTGRHHLSEELHRSTLHDTLTGLPNRDQFLRQLDLALAEPAPDQCVGVCFVDIDGFKMINDSWGHLVGDQVLVGVAERFTPVAAAAGASLARLAGDEFVALTTGQSARSDPAKLGEALLATLDQPLTIAPGEELTVSASAGVVNLPSDRATATGLLRAADLALHTAKAEARGRLVTHDEARTERQVTRSGVATSLPGVVERDELALAYQPMVRLSDGRLHGVEALLRWPHPRLGQLPPELFVGVAEESSAIIAIGRWVLARACGDLAARGWPLVSVNVSVRQLASRGFVDDVARILDETGVSADRLRLEVTESVIAHGGHPGPLDALASLVDLGVGIVLDDFGAAQANLTALRRLPLVEVKLAGSFVGVLSHRPPDPLDAHVVVTVVDLAHAMGLGVTAEGIETPDLDREIRVVGCDVAQGWLYGTPRRLE
jgi:diguanylate cyclase (GGDEF)-like protein/PAS domain S-box-containing protein